MRIYKYTLRWTDEQELSLPAKARVLSVCEQNNNIVVYALIENDSDVRDTWSVKIIGTGHDTGNLNDYTFYGTVNIHDGAYMWHVFAKWISRGISK